MKELIEKSNLIKLNSPTKSIHSNDDITSSNQSIKSNLFSKAHSSTS
jgi:hypothetical protein